MEKAYEWLMEEFADRLDGDEQYEFLEAILDGTIGLTESEIRDLCWN